MAYLSKLIEIRLQWCHGITDIGIQALTSNCPRLRLIDLKSCLITDESVNSIARCSKYLEVLDLSWCSLLTDSCLENFVAYQSNNINMHQSKGIEKLYLVWCSNLTDRGVSCLLSLASTLKKVDISGCSQVSNDCSVELNERGIEVIQ